MKVSRVASIACFLGCAVWGKLAVSAQPTAEAGSSLRQGLREGERAIKSFQVAPPLKVDLWAAEPLLENPVAFNFDEKGRAFVCETFRLGAGVDDVRGIMDWLDEELAARTVDDRLEEMKRHLGDRFPKYSEASERIRLLEDRQGTGRADHSTIFAAGFNTALDGIGAGVLARKGNVWYANIPNLWLLRDTNSDGVADLRQSLHYGFGVRVGFLGHDLHGIHFGPDGKLYFSVGDRGSNIKLAGGRSVGDPDTGCVFRCYPDGSDLEVFSFGLRNPQDLVFDQYGNLFTGDNNSDSGDQARWVYLVEGGDCGWRVGYQFMENPYSRGPFNAEKLWYPHFEGQAAYIVPPIANIASGPSGVAYYPGTGLPDNFKEHFFLVDFRGSAAGSGVHSFTLSPKGAFFELIAPSHFIWGVLPTDVKFGPDGGLYLTDWVEGWGLTGKGRIYRVHDLSLDKNRAVLEVKELLASGMEKRSLKELTALLGHADMRVRQEAQFELAERGAPAIDILLKTARKNDNRLVRLHAIWALGQICARSPQPPDARIENMLVGVLTDPDAEVRAQSAKVLGKRRCECAFQGLAQLLRDSSARVRFFAALSLGKLGRREALPALFSMLRENADADPYLRHAGVMGLTWIGDTDALIRAAKDSSPSVRMAALLALRRIQRPEIAMFLHDPSLAIVLEAARAINDVPINGAMPDLAALIDSRVWLDTNAFAEPLLRRVLNANFHFGTPDSAKALGLFAARADAPENMRAEALEELADWPHPSGLDRVVGLWRPVAATRRPETAVEALEPVMPAIFHSGKDKVRIALIRAVSRLAISNAAPNLSEILADTKATDELRIEALKALASLDSVRFERALDLAQTDPREKLRRAAITLEGQAGTPNAPGRLATTLADGSVGEKQAAFAILAGLHDPMADNILAQWMDKLNEGKVPEALQLDLIQAAAKRSDISVRQKLSQYNASRPKSDPLAEFRETLFGGDAAQGKTIFFDRPDAQCVRCHRIDGQGGDVGPDLSHIGGQKERTYLLESILFPNKQIAQGFESVLVTLKDNESYAGVLKSENAGQIVINSPNGGLLTFEKTNILSRQKALSPMPEGMDQVLSKEDLRNLVEYLFGLK